MPHVCYTDRVERYRRIKQLKAQGCTYDQIAQRLGICRNTVGDVVNGKCVIGAMPAYLSGSRDLSKSELPIAKLLIEGKSNEKIAQLLYLSPKTVSWYVYTIYKKLGILGDPSISRRVVAVSMLKEILERSL